MLRIPYYVPPKLASDTFPILGYAMPYLITQDGDYRLFMRMLMRVLALNKDQQKQVWDALGNDSRMEAPMLRLPGAIGPERHPSLPESFIYEWIASTPATEANKQAACEAIRQHFSGKSHLLPEAAEPQGAA